MKNLLLSGAMAALALSAFGQAGSWKNDDQFDMDVRMAYWSWYRDHIDWNPDDPASPPITVTLNANYLLTTEHDFSKYTYPGNSTTPVLTYPSRDAIGTGYQGDKKFGDGSTSFLPWKKLILRVEDGTDKTANWNPLDQYAAQGGRPAVTIAPGGANGRIVPGFRAQSTSWHHLDPNDDDVSNQFNARLPDASRYTSASNPSTVYWIEMGDSTRLPEGETKVDYYHTDEFGNLLRLDQGWPRFGNNDITDPAIRFDDLSRALAVSIGDHELAYASEDFSTEPDSSQSSGTRPFRWNFVGPTTAGNQTVLPWATTIGTDKIAHFTNAADAALASDRYSWYLNSHTRQSDVRCTVFTYQDYSAYEVGVDSISESATTSGRNINFTLDTNPFIGAASDFTRGQRYRVWNAPEFLDKTGEMVLDRPNHRLYFIPFDPPGTSGSGAV